MKKILLLLLCSTLVAMGMQQEEAKEQKEGYRLRDVCYDDQGRIIQLYEEDNARYPHQYCLRRDRDGQACDIDFEGHRLGCLSALPNGCIALGKKLFNAQGSIGDWVFYPSMVFVHKNQLYAVNNDYEGNLAVYSWNSGDPCIAFQIKDKEGCESVYGKSTISDQFCTVDCDEGIVKMWDMQTGHQASSFQLDRLKGYDCEYGAAGLPAIGALLVTKVIKNASIESDDSEDSEDSLCAEEIGILDLRSKSTGLKILFKGCQRGEANHMTFEVCDSGSHFALIGPDSKLRLWDVRKVELPIAIKDISEGYADGATLDIFNLHCAPDGKKVMLVNRDHQGLMRGYKEISFDE